MIVQIPVGDHFALVDEADAPTVRAHRWYFNGSYAMRHERGRTVYMHRELMGLVHGDGHRVDHRNRNKLDNRRENLRLGTHAENMQNHPGYGGSSEFRGVFWNTKLGKWGASATLNGKTKHLGLFVDEQQAARAAADFRAKHMPFSEEAAA